MSWLEFGAVLLGQVFVAGAIYGGIRADLKALTHRVTEAHALAGRAHRRIDEMLLNKGD